MAQHRTQRTLLKIVLSAIAISPLTCLNVPLPGRTETCTISPRYNGALSGTRIRSDGTTLLKGKPFFPFGFYHVSWYSSSDTLLADLQTIAAGGFNTVHASAAFPDTYQVVLDTAHTLGLQLITEDGSPELAARYGSHPAVLAWNIADDVDNGKQDPNAVAAKNQAVGNADRRHLTYVSGYSSNLPAYVNTAGVLAMQSYPIAFGHDDEISATYPQVAILTNAVRTCNRAAYANVQSFNWAIANPQTPGVRSPTSAEVRNMTYQAIVAGVKGILYYTFVDRDWNLPRDSPQLWDGLKALVPEIKHLSPYLLNGRVTPIQTGHPKVFAGFWQLGQEAILIVVNASYQSSPSLSLTLPVQAKSQQILFSDQPAIAQKPAPNQLLLGLKPLNVIVYQMQL
jgi:hypothetical protein